MAAMPAAAQVELPAMPGADQMRRAGDVVDAQATPLRIEPFLDARHQAALADRPALVGAFVAVGQDGAIDPKQADLDFADGDDFASAFGDVFLTRHPDLPHADRSPVLSPVGGSLRNVAGGDQEKIRKAPLSRR